MSKVTTKYQVTLPKRIADEYAIRPGDEIDWVAAGDSIRVIPPGRKAIAVDRESQLRLFDQATARHLRRSESRGRNVDDQGDRGWTREDLYDRGSTAWHQTD
jgi:AbrB family looped-hinge helix DNA binding protein